VDSLPTSQYWPLSLLSPCPLVAGDEASDVASSDSLHHPRQSAFRRWCDEQVDVVGHQHVRMYGAIMLVRGFLQFDQVTSIVMFIGEADLPVITALYQVPGYAGNIDSW